MNSPKFKQKDYIGINGVGVDQLKHPHFEIWQQYFKNEYDFNLYKELILFLPCAAIKPYYNSPIHREINKIVEKYEEIQKIVISNAGIIPYEYCDKYPFESYDWNPLFETPIIKKEYIRLTSRRIFELFDAKKLNKNIKFLAYLRNDSESLESLKIAFSKLKFKLDIVLLKGHLHETADTDLQLILKDNLIKLDLLINELLNK